MKRGGNRVKAFRKTLLVYRVARRQADIEHEIETSKCCKDAYVTNTDTSPSISVREGTARLREKYR